MPIKFTYPDPTDLPSPGTLRMCAQGFVVIRCDAPYTIDGKAGTAHYATFQPLIEIEVDPSVTSIEVRTDTIENLDLNELQGAVEWLGVSTTATSTAGLREAIKRHLSP